MSADLASWLLEQIAEDEQIALEVLDGGGLVDPQSYGWQADSAGFGDPDYGALIMCMKFAARWRPRAVLAECEAKRKIVKRCALLLEAFDDPERGAWHDVNRRERYHARATLEALALPYADRPGYRQEWRP